MRRVPARRSIIEIVLPSVLEGLCERDVVRGMFVRLPAMRRRAVVRAALKAASDRGPSRLNVKTVARLARVPVGSLYQYFGGRRQLVLFVCELASRALCSVLERNESRLTCVPLSEGLKSYLSDSLAWCRKEAVLTRIYAVSAYNLALLSERALEQAPAESLVVKSIAATVHRLMRAMVLAAKARGELRAGLDAEEACRILNVLCIGVIDAALLPGLNEYLRLVDTRHDQATMLESAVDIALHGLTG
jgi:AcrR family transcriptional regulator